MFNAKQKQEQQQKKRQKHLTCDYHQNKGMFNAKFFLILSKGPKF